ncbi:MAG: hypothetical protein D6718_09075 [Acidobacteria bacterium]|nr:MAG: hypothetical protein D6718_09075 [Acidobacteriota bacterium]
MAAPLTPLAWPLPDRCTAAARQVARLCVRLERELEGEPGRAAGIALERLLATLVSAAARLALVTRLPPKARPAMLAAARREVLMGRGLLAVAGRLAPDRARKLEVLAGGLDVLDRRLAELQREAQVAISEGGSRGLIEGTARRL